MKINPEYPRSTLVRSSFVSLNGEWDFKDEWTNGVEYPKDSKKIIVPFSPETKASGLAIIEQSKFFTYGRKFNYQKTDGKRLLLHFEGVDYIAALYINNTFVSTHTGAYDRFSTDITDYVKDGENEIVLSVFDDDSRLQVRGKQRWENHVYGCFYVPTSGIYKPVWMEEVSSTYISSIKTRTTQDTASILLSFTGTISDKTKLSLSLFDKEQKLVYHVTKDVNPNSDSIKMDITFDGIHKWDIDDPYLYDLYISLIDNEKERDNVSSYIGFRTIESKKDRFYLNNKEIFLKMILDQGYFKDSGLTAKGKEDLEKDVRLIKEMGFNGVRKHQKIEDERFYSLCDEYGLLCFLEMPSMYTYSEEGAASFIRQWTKIIKEHDHHPSIMAYVPFNETWGINDLEFIQRKDIQAFVNDVVDITKKYDPTRFVISDDGWEHTNSDILTLHVYEQDARVFKDNYSFKQAITASPIHNRKPYAPGYQYNGQPIVFSEFGGTSFAKDVQGEAWGYGTISDEREYLNKIKSLIDMLHSLPYCRGYCYTQLTDVEQEVNGLLYIDRTPKVAIEKIRSIIENGGK